MKALLVLFHTLLLAVSVWWLTQSSRVSAVFMTLLLINYFHQKKIRWKVSQMFSVLRSSSEAARVCWCASITAWCQSLNAAWWANTKHFKCYYPQRKECRTPACKMKNLPQAHSASVGLVCLPLIPHQQSNVQEQMHLAGFKKGNKEALNIAGWVHCSVFLCVQLCSIVVRLLSTRGSVVLIMRTQKITSCIWITNQ